MADLELFMEGAPGEILVEAFLRVMGDSIAILGQVDSVMTGRSTPTLEWFIEDLSMGSVHATLSARPRRGLLRAHLEPVEPEPIVRAVVEGFEVVEHAPSVPAHFAPPSVQRVERIARRLGHDRGPKALRLVAGKGKGKAKPGKARVTNRAADNAHAALVARTAATGSVIGRLEAISLHKRRVFNVYETISRRAVTCTFSEEQLEEVKAALGHRVVARGLVRRNQLGQAVGVLVEDLETLASDESLPTFSDIAGSDPDFTGGRSVEEYVRLLREA